MKDFSIHAFNAIKTNLAELPSFCRLVIFELLSYCDYEKGIISISTLDEVAHNDFHVAPSPGRKKEAITSDTLRNAFRTIKKFKPEHFIFRTQNQRVIIEMPFLRELYQQHISKLDQVTAVELKEDKAPTTQASSDDPGNLDDLFTGEDAPDVAAASFGPIKDINNLTKQNITNKPWEGRSKDFKKPISPDFYPSQETIRIAMENGFVKVTDIVEIQKFIKHNAEKNRRWEDYNPVFLDWLKNEREFSLPESRQQPELAPKTLRSNNNERSSNKNNSYERAMEQVFRDNPSPLIPSEDLFALKPFNLIEFVNPAHQLALDQTNGNLRTNVYQ